MEPLTKAELKQFVHRVVVAQGNAFIKELLRNNGVKIGSTKEDFAENLDAAIDDEVITQAILETWLAEVEGWGDQYLYLLTPLTLNPQALPAAIASSQFAQALNATASLEFPDQLELKAIKCSNHELSIVWHQRKESWSRSRSLDFRRDEGLEHYRFDAYLQRLERSVVRYEWRFDDPFSAVLIHRNPEIDHAAVFATVHAALVSIGASDNPLAKISLTQAVKAAARSGQGVHSTRFEHQDGYVEMASTLAERGIEAVEPVRAALFAVDATQFNGAQGMLYFTANEHDISRRITAQVFGSQGKLRIWAQCKREDVYRILQYLWNYNAL